MKFGRFEAALAYTEGATEHNEFYFKNGYGASVIRGPFSYGGWDGLFELAVLRKRRGYWDITYDTQVSNNVLGWLTAEEVTEKLTEISSWKKRR
ncbi:hypothetical protein ACE418_01240 [Megasphaera sp. WILCCON 0056]|uniref:hypothetical protein n=1 Tax=Megasphaera sp. WILCCON 0056 TaxID=3345340 RepID=UPI003A813457